MRVVTVIVIFIVAALYLSAADAGHDELRLAGVAHQRAGHRQVQLPVGRLVELHLQLLALVVALDKPLAARRNTNLRYS